MYYIKRKQKIISINVILQDCRTNSTNSSTLKSRNPMQTYEQLLELLLCGLSGLNTKYTKRYRRPVAFQAILIKAFY